MSPLILPSVYFGSSFEEDLMGDSTTWYIGIGGVGVVVILTVERQSDGLAAELVAAL